MKTVKKLFKSSSFPNFLNPPSCIIVHIIYFTQEDDELPTVAEQPTKSLLWTSVEYLGFSIGVALVCGILFHLLWTRRRGKETKRNDAMSGEYMSQSNTMSLIRTDTKKTEKSS